MTLQELGQEIRAQREEQGFSVDDMAQVVKISARTLRAIEEGNLNALPHTVYAKGFIRSYGLVLRMDGDELNSRLEKVFPSEMFDDAKPEPGPVYRAEPTPGGPGRFMAVLIVLVLVAAAVGGGWYVAVNHGDDLIRLIKQPFSAGNGVEVAADSTLGGVASARENATVAAVQETPAPASPAVPAEPSANASLPIESPTPPVSAPQVAAPSVNELVFTAKANCWVGYRTDDGPEKDYTVRKGETFKLSYKKNVSVKLGNPSGVSITLNGTDYNFTYQQNRTAEFSLP